MKEPLVTLNVSKTTTRVLLGIVAIFVVAFAWFGVRWQLGTMLAELTPPGDPNARYAAPAAHNLAPQDPMASWLMASVENNISAGGADDHSAESFADAVRLSPNDYRWWVELGRANEQAGRQEQAELAFQRAIFLAPSYVYPRWQFGNFLLRSGQADEAFVQLRMATVNNQTYRDQVFALAWDYFQHDPSRIEALVAATPDVRVGLALFYARHGEAAASLRIWNTLSDAEKAAEPQTARILAQALTDRRFFRQGLEFSKQAGIDPDAQAEAITNGDFEKPIGSPEDNFYGWNAERGDGKLEITTDSSIKRGGNRSLRLVFRGFAKPQLGDPWEIVVTEPEKTYELHFWARTENLRSAGMPQIEIVDPTDNHVIAASPTLDPGNNDWHEMVVQFQAPTDSEGIIVRVARAFCGDACPIVGTLWLDDFLLRKR